ncbi:hypothetical protein GN956_G12938 [Arapaima gigas]
MHLVMAVAVAGTAPRGTEGQQRGLKPAGREGGLCKPPLTDTQPSATLSPQVMIPSRQAAGRGSVVESPGPGGSTPACGARSQFGFSPV